MSQPETEKPGRASFERAFAEDDVVEQHELLTRSLRDEEVARTLDCADGPHCLLGKHSDVGWDRRWDETLMGSTCVTQCVCDPWSERHDRPHTGFQ